MSSASQVSNRWRITTRYLVVVVYREILGHVLPIDALHPLRDIFDEALGVTVLAAAFMPVF